jgi:osmotically-inducible protein OsmY
MRKTLFSFLAVALLSLVAVTQDAGQGKTRVKEAATSSAPKSDAEIQTCINDKFKASTKIKNGNAEVSGGAATLTGEAVSVGAKGGATRSAKACGAKTVTNNITTPSKPKKA